MSSYAVWSGLEEIALLAMAALVWWRWHRQRHPRYQAARRTSTGTTIFDLLKESFVRECLTLEEFEDLVTAYSWHEFFDTPIPPELARRVEKVVPKGSASGSATFLDAYSGEKPKPAEGSIPVYVLGRREPVDHYADGTLG